MIAIKEKINNKINIKLRFVILILSASFAS